MRGPKVRSAENSHGNRRNFIRRDNEESPCELSEPAKAEYERLIEVLRSKGTLDRVDLVVVSNAARMKGVLDQLFDRFHQNPLDGKTLSTITMVSSQHRGLLRELGLTIKPSNTNLRVNPVPDEEDSLSSHIKLRSG